MARKSRRTRRLRVVNPDCAGIDIGKDRHFVAVDPERSEEPVRSFGAFTRDLEEMAVAGKGAERTHRLLAAFRVDRHEMPVLADVDPCAVRVHHPEAPGSSRLARHGTSSQVSSPSRAGRNHVRSPILLIEVTGNPRHQ